MEGFTRESIESISNFISAEGLPVSREMKRVINDEKGV